MHEIPPRLQRPLSRRLLPLAYALMALVGVILLLTWFALQIQVTLAGFLNSESVWSKAQKQAVISLDAYAISGDSADMATFRRNYIILDSDRKARDEIASGFFDRAVVSEAFVRGNVMPSAKSGMIFMLQHFHRAPHMYEALREWRATDTAIAQLDAIAREVHQYRLEGGSDQNEIRKQIQRINALNDVIEPRANQFSVEIAEGAVWLGRVLFGGVLAAATIAVLLWILMARRTLASIRGTEERYRLLFDSASDAIVMVDETSGRILDANRAASEWTGRRAGEFIRDISERVAMERERRIAAEALASIAEGVIIADPQRRVISVNDAHEQLTGFDADALRDKRFDATRRLPDGHSLPQSIWDDIAAGRNWLGEVQSVRRDGTSYPEQLSISAIRDTEHQVLYYVAVFTNISATKQQQQRLEHLARHDPLTGLVNRAEFERYCSDAIAIAERERLATVVLFIDLDAFKIVNDSYSHAIGDRLLVKVAERIRRQLSEGDVAGRIGGDEFTVLIHHLNLREDARVMAERLLAVLSEPLLVDDYEIVLSASIGIAGYPLDGLDAATLVANADAAMYAAKTEERNTLRFYTPMMHANTSRRLLLATELRQALVREEFRLVYQPSIEMRTGRIVAVEALVRWQHPDRGEVLPSEFIPVAESLGLIRRIDEWVMQTACAQIEAWDLAGMPPVRVAVNVSARGFGHAAFIDGVSRAMQQRRVPPGRLMLEITESAMLRMGDDTERTMRALHGLGLEVAIDDFGTGYSSMAYLKLPAVAYLKIDRSFVSGLPESTDDVAIIEAMLAMSRSLGLKTIAEGIETEAQHEFLLRAGCSEGQG